MTINATLINLYQVCKRECWLHANGVRMEHTSEIVSEGKLLHETSYQDRAAKHNELELTAEFEGIILTGKIDFYDARNKQIHETKRGDKVEEAHQWQVKFYLWMLALNGIEEATAILEYPLLRNRDLVRLSDEDVYYLKNILYEVLQLKDGDSCPPVINSKICRKCSYYEFCYINE